MGRWATVLVLTGCTAANPLFHADAGGPPPPDLAQSPRDLAGPDDLARPPRDLSRAPIDLTTGGVCTGDARTCAPDSSASESCVNGAVTVDRECPGTSRCSAGYCQPPFAGVGTLGHRCDGNGGAQEGQCMPMVATDPTCAPFVDPLTGALAWYCAKPIGPGGPGAACSAGAECRSGFCGSNGTCFRACQTDQDCPPSATGRRLRCGGVQITVEGVVVEQPSCIP
jgi:hypothetical protein